MDSSSTVEHVDAVYLPTHEQHSVYRRARHLWHCRQHVQFFLSDISHSQDLSRRHLLTRLAQTCLLQAKLLVVNKTININPNRRTWFILSFSYVISYINSSWNREIKESNLLTDGKNLMQEQNSNCQSQKPTIYVGYGMKLVSDPSQPHFIGWFTGCTVQVTFLLTYFLYTLLCWHSNNMQRQNNPLINANEKSLLVLL